MRLIIDNTPTRASIAASYAAMLADRRSVEQQIGVSITDSGRVKLALVTAHCPSPGCRFAAEGRTETEALASVSHHMLAKHWPQPTQGAA